MPRLFVLAVLLAAGLVGCRGMESDAPPIHLNRNMDFQQRYDPQEANDFFADGRAMRPPPVGTVARGMLKDDAPFYYGRTESGAYVDVMPVDLTRDLVERGAERYEIFCAVCHGSAGDGQGVIMRGGYGYAPAPSYHTDYLRGISDGYMYDVIANGVRNMPGYAQQIPTADRWAIVAYVRALQRSQAATDADVPPSVRAQVEQGGSGNIGGGRSGTGGAPGANPAPADAPQDAPAQNAPADTTQGQ